MRKGVICVCRYVLTLYLYLYLFSYFLHRHNQALIERETTPNRGQQLCMVWYGYIKSMGCFHISI